MMTDVIKKVYDEMIFTVCLGIEEEYHPLIEQNYFNILMRRYSETDVRLKLNDYSKVYTIVRNIEYKSWVSLSPSAKKFLLIDDPALNEILCISNHGSSLAIQRAKDGSRISTEQANAMIQKMHELYASVHAENRFTAEKHISEGTVDLMFASGQTNGVSLRSRRLLSYGHTF